MELTQQIASLLPMSDLTQLSLVDRFWNAAAEPRFYRHIMSVYALHHAIDKPADERGIRLLWNVAQHPRRAAHVRTLNASAMNGSWSWSPLHLCGFCELRSVKRTDDVRHCAVLHAPLPEELFGSIQPEVVHTSTNSGAGKHAAMNSQVQENEWLHKIYAVAGRKIMACKRADHSNRLVYWANFYVALKACVNATAINFPATASDRSLYIACLELLTERVRNNTSTLVVVQLEYSLFDERNPLSSSPENDPPFQPSLPFIRFIESIRSVLRVLVLGHSTTSIGPGVIAYLADNGISIILPASQDLNSGINILPVLYDVPNRGGRKTLGQYFDDVRAYFLWTSSSSALAVQINFHPSQTNDILFALAEMLSPVAGYLKTLTLGVAWLNLALEAGWQDLEPVCAVDVAAVVEATKTLSKRCNVFATDTWPVRAVVFAFGQGRLDEARLGFAY